MDLVNLNPLRTKILQTIYLTLEMKIVKKAGNCLFKFYLLIFYKLKILRNKNFDIKCIDKRRIKKKFNKENSSRNNQDKNKNYSNGQWFRSDSSNYLNNKPNKVSNGMSYNSISKLVQNIERTSNEDNFDALKSRNLNNVGKNKGTDIMIFSDSQQSSSGYLGFKTLYATNYI